MFSGFSCLHGELSGNEKLNQLQSLQFYYTVVE